jgi:hypothetical protein
MLGGDCPGNDLDPYGPGQRELASEPLTSGTEIMLGELLYSATHTNQ